MLFAAFMSVDPKSAKMTVKSSVILRLVIKAACKHVGEIRFLTLIIRIKSQYDPQKNNPTI